MRERADFGDEGQPPAPDLKPLTGGVP